MVDVRPVVSLRVGSRRADVVLVGRSVDRDQLRLVVRLGLLREVVLDELAVLHLAERLRGLLGPVHHLCGVAEGRLGALGDLLEVRGRAIGHPLGRDVERNRGVGEPQRVHAGVEAVELALYGLHLVRDGDEVLRGRPVYSEQPLVVEGDVKPALLHSHPARVVELPFYVAAGRVVREVVNGGRVGESPRVGDQALLARVDEGPLRVEFRGGTVSIPEAQLGYEAPEADAADQDVGGVHRQAAERDIPNLRAVLVDDSQGVLVAVERNGEDRVRRNVLYGSLRDVATTLVQPVADAG